MRVENLLLLSALTISSSALAQGVNGRGGPQDRIKVIDFFPLPPPAAPGKVPVSVAATHDLPAPLEDTFVLHSNPGATKVIYLDFDGHTVSWMGDEFVYEPWDTDGHSSLFSMDERTVIQLAWQSISEDFMPFDLDVTTEDPGTEALRNTGGDDEEWGVRAVINHINYSYSWAYQGSFTDSEDVELYAWSGNFISMDETWIWMADSVSHEAGHALGLSHDGTTTGVEYYEGHGTGDTAWSPIMGWTNYGLSQWDRGEYTLANNFQDDLSIITSMNGFGHRLDDHGSTADSATAVDIDLPWVVEGVIEETADIDYFSFTMATGGHRFITVRPDNLAPNLDLVAEIHDADGAVLFSSNPPTALDAEFEVFLSAGDYYLSVDGTGYEDPDSDGYSDYGSLGSYVIESYVDEDTGDTGDTEDTEDTEDTGDTGDTKDTEDTGDTESTESTESTEDTEDTGDSKDTEDSKDVDDGGSCNCSTSSALWPGAMFLLPFFLVRRRESGRTHESGGRGGPHA